MDIDPSDFFPLWSERPGPYRPEPDRDAETRFCIALIDAAGSLRRHLLQALILVQRRFGHISPHAKGLLADGMNASVPEIDGLIDFYSFLEHRFCGQYQVRVSDSITDRMLGSEALIQRLLEAFATEEGAPDAGGRVSIRRTSCTGLCDQGPALLINGVPLTCAGPERLEQIIALMQAGTSLVEWPDALFAIRPGVVTSGPLLASPFQPGEALQRLHQQGSDALLAEVERSGLRGRGGAGFQTYLKLVETLRTQAVTHRFVVCNADEGEPGTFKDRVLLSEHPHQVFEGMTLGARLIGATRGYLYLRGEYAHLYAPLQQVLQERRERGLLGKQILGQAWDFDIDIHLGAGAYVCGEETALLESLEGKRGIARVRPPFPAERGFLSFPTQVNNVETFCCLTEIALHGGNTFAAAGVAGSSGSKLHSVSGDCREPGIYELPWGSSVRELLALCGGEQAQAVQVGGPSGTLLHPDEFDRCLSFDDLPTGGSFIVFGPQRNLLQAVRNFTAFFAHESCGFCTPCRAGCPELLQVVERLAEGQAGQQELLQVRRLATLMRDASHCGLGRTAANPLMDWLDKWLPQDSTAIFSPRLDLQAATAAARELRDE